MEQAYFTAIWRARCEVQRERGDSGVIYGEKDPRKEEGEVYLFSRHDFVIHILPVTYSFILFCPASFFFLPSSKF